MQSAGLNLTLLAFQLLNLALCATAVVLVVLAFRRISRAPLTASERLAWFALALFAPFLGALVVLLLLPDDRRVTP